MRVAINPLQWDELNPDGVGGVVKHDSPEVLRELAALGFGAVSAEPEAVGGVQACRDLLASAGLDPAPGYHSAPLSAGRLDADALARAGAFADAHAELGLTEACLADDLIEERVRRPLPQSTLSASSIARIVEGVNTIAEIWGERGVTPCIHNHVGTGIQMEFEVDAVLAETASSGVQFCPDTGHLAWAGVDPVSAVRRHRDRVALLHVKDVSDGVAQRGPAGGWSYGATVKAGLWTEPGYGCLDLAGVLSELVVRPRWLIIEVDHSTVSPQESTRRCQEWVARMERRA